MGLLDGLLNPLYNEQQTGLLNTAQTRLRGLLDTYNRNNPLFSNMLHGEPFGGNVLDNVYKGLAQFGGVGQRMTSGDPLAALDIVGAGAMGMPGMAGITAYHGSPHKFDKFDMSKIGTGEGAQAYGHGLYFAESPGVANNYAQTLADKPKDLMGSYIEYSAKYGRPLGEQSTSAGYLKEQGFPTEHAPLLDRIISGAKVSKDGSITYSLDAIRAFKQLDSAIPTKGHTYAVDLPDDQIAKMLDWDKPLSEQPESVRKALEPAIMRTKANSTLSDEEFLKSMGSANGAKLYEYLRVYGGLKEQSQASEYLRSLGIPGIKYFDGSSRSAGEGTRNFVVFSDDIPKILKRE